MLTLTNYIYDITGNQRPETGDLDEEVDRLLFLKGVEEPNYLVGSEDSDGLNELDIEITAHWLKRKIEPALLVCILEPEDNYHRAKTELNKMTRYSTFIERLFRASFLRSRAKLRSQELLFEESELPSLDQATKRLKKVLTFLSKHLETYSENNYTLYNTDRYTNADILLYNYLKRIVVGRYKDSGIRAHLMLCDPLIQFMSRYAKKNTYVIDVSQKDSLADEPDQSGLLHDMTKPAMVVLGLLLFYSWRHELLS